MPHVSRRIRQAAEYEPAKDLDKVSRDEVLDTVSASQLSGLLLQLSRLTSHAKEIFGGLQAECAAISERTAAVNQRISQASQSITGQSYSQLTKNRFVRAPERPISQGLFLPATRTPSVQQAYEKARPRPRFEDFNRFSADGSDCAKKFSNPHYFFEQWLLAEQARQEEAAARRREGRKGRRKKKKKKGGPKRQKVVAAKLVTKKYNAMGAEFDPSQAEQQQELIRQRTLEEERARKAMQDHANAEAQAEHERYRASLQSQSASGARVSAAMPHGSAPPPPPQPRGGGMSVSTSAPPPPPPQRGAAPSHSQSSTRAPPPPPQQRSGAPPPPPVPGGGGHIPSPPSVPTAPAAPPVPLAPAAPPVPAGGIGGTAIPAAPSGGGGGGAARGGLMAQIAGGGHQLRKVDPAQMPKPKPDARSTLMDQIRSMKSQKLRRVQVEERKKPAGGGGFGDTVASILARRAAIEGSDSEDSDDSDDEWED